MSPLVLLGLAGLVAVLYYALQPTPAEAALPPESDQLPLDVTAPPDFGPPTENTGLDHLGLDPSSLGTTFSKALASLALPASFSLVLTGRAGDLPLSEQAAIMDVAATKGVDPRALAAIRLQENGAPGREFGVLSVLGESWYQERVAQVGTFRAQAEVAAQSLKNAEPRYTAFTGAPAKDASGNYTAAFWIYFGSRWAPIGAANDPRGLNRYWVTNVVGNYQQSGVA